MTQVSKCFCYFFVKSQMKSCTNKIKDLLWIVYLLYWKDDVKLEKKIKLIDRIRLVVVTESH